MKKVIAFCCMPCIFLITIAMESNNFIPDVWNQIIAQIPDKNKNILSYTCTTLNRISKRLNHHIYTHSPLVLSPRNLITALLYATHYQNRSAIENLLKHDANPNTHIHLHVLPLSLAKHQKNEENIKLLEKYNAHNYTVMCPIYSLAAFVGDLPLLKTYIQNEAIPTHFEKLYPRNSLLYNAIFNGHTHIVEYVLQTPTLRYLKDIRYNNLTTLYYAALNKRHAITELLLEASPDILNDTCGYHELSALHITVMKRYYYITQLLLAHSTINVNARDKYGDTPLHLAVNNSDIDITQLLLSHPNIKPLVKNKRNQTALDIADDLQKKNQFHQLFKEKYPRAYFYHTQIAPWEHYK